MLETDEGELIAQSNEVLCYLADGSACSPRGLERAQVLQWLCSNRSVSRLASMARDFDG